MSFLIMTSQRIWRSGVENNQLHEIHSPFISDYIERRERQGRLRAWTTGEDDAFAGAMTRGLTWGKRGRPIEAVRVRYQDAAPDGRGGFYYAVNFGAVGGLFHQDASGRERRLFHRESFVCAGLSYQDSGQRFVAALNGENGTTRLVLLDENGRETHWLTEGDCNDAWPAWDPARPSVVLYQSSGCAYRDDGLSESGPWEAMELDLDRGQTTPLWRREGMDVLLPRRDRQGRLYALIRPYGNVSPPLREYARRVASMPWIFAQAVFGFANAFTSIFARKPLWTAGGPEARVESRPGVRILGKQLETKALQNRNAGNPSVRSCLAPESWQLWRRDPDGSEHRIAANVSWYSLAADGTPYYTTGLAIHASRDDGEETVYEGKLVEAFVPLS